MSTLRTKRWKTARAYAFAAALCVIFSAVYESFSHGVWSWWMALLALWPLLGGALPYAVAAWHRPPRAHWLARWCHGAGLITCIVGSALKGVLDIYGTASELLIVYPVLGVALLTASAVLLLAQRR